MLSSELQPPSIHAMTCIRTHLPYFSESKIRSLYSHSPPSSSHRRHKPIPLPLSPTFGYFPPPHDQSCVCVPYSLASTRSSPSVVWNPPFRHLLRTYIWVTLCTLLFVFGLPYRFFFLSIFAFSYIFSLSSHLESDAFFFFPFLRLPLLQTVLFHARTGYETKYKIKNNAMTSFLTLPLGLSFSWLRQRGLG